MGYKEDIVAMQRVADEVKDKPRFEAVYSIISRATELVKAQADPASEAGQVLLSALLDYTAWSILRSGSVFEDIRQMAQRFNPKIKPKKSE